MPDLILIFQKWWKRFLAVIFTAVLLAALVLFLLPKKYLSTATALPASSLATDKGAVFGNGLQELYSSLGTPDELDRFLGTAQLDTIYIAVARAHQLPQHYQVKQNDHALYNAALKLKKETRIERTEFGELQIKVWDVDRDIAAQLANDLIQQLQLLHQQLQSSSNNLVLQKLKAAYNNLQATDSLPTRNVAMGQQAAEYEKLIAQYTLMVNTNPPALLVVESARPGLTPDKPYVWPTLLLTFFTAMLFSILMALLLENRATRNG